MTLIRFQDVTRQYVKGDHVVIPLEHVDLEVDKGEFLVLLGPSGSGKTTMLNLVAGIDRPDGGKIQVADQDLSELTRNQLADWRAENVGYVFQQHNLVPVLTAYENVELPLWLFPFSKDERHKRVSLALEAVGLADRWDHKPSQLSGGQEQRVGIARAIVADPPIIVADEPTGDLDQVSAQATLELLSRFNQERGKTILMVTHDPKAAGYGTRTLYLDKGKLRDPEGAMEGGL